MGKRPKKEDVCSVHPLGGKDVDASQVGLTLVSESCTLGESDTVDTGAGSRDDSCGDKGKEASKAPWVDVVKKNKENLQ